MWFKDLVESLTSSSSRRQPTRRRPPTSRLYLEALEDRWVPSYSIIDLGTLGGDVSRANDLNASGQTSREAQRAQCRFLPLATLAPLASPAYLLTSSERAILRS